MDECGKFAAMMAQVLLLQAQLAAQDQSAGLPQVPIPDQADAGNEMPMDVINGGQEKQLAPHLHGGHQESAQTQDHNMEGDDDLMNLRGGGGHSFYLENTTYWSVTSLVLYNQRGHPLYVDDSNLGPVDVLKDANQQGIIEDEIMARHYWSAEHCWRWKIAR
jgi:hypothetical protein